MTPTAEQILETLADFRLLRQAQAAMWRVRLGRDPRLQRSERLLTELVRSRTLTRFQARAVYQGNAPSLAVGDYVLYERLGGGAMGHVYKARHRTQPGWTAVKILREEWSQSPRHIERFHREVRAANLIHPHIVSTLDAGCDRGRHFLVMEYVEGTNLDRRLRERGLPSIELAVRWCLQAARGLAYAHGRGVIHRDVKPSNLLLEAKSKAVKILDLGIARHVRDEEEIERLTHSGQILGTPHYMAPEQAFDPKRVGPQADIYSLGCTFYRLLTGEPPFTGETDYEILLAHLRADTPPPSARRDHVPPTIDAICAHMMAKALDDRYFSLAEVIADLEAALTTAPRNSPGEAQPVGAAMCEEATVTAVGKPPLVLPPSARWRLPETAPAATPRSSNPCTEAATPTIRPYLAWRGPRTSRPSAKMLALPWKGTRTAGALRNWASLVCAMTVAAGCLSAGLWWAAHTERAGYVAMEIHPTPDWVEVFDPARDLELRRRAENALSFRAPPGTYRVRVTKAGFLPYVREFALESGKRTTIYAVLQRQ